MKVHAYLNFNGNCKEAFDFYETVFDTKCHAIHYFGDMPADPNMPLSEEDKNKIMHVGLKINDSCYLMGSDCLQAFGQKAVSGNNTYIMLDTATALEATELYNKFANTLQDIEMPLSEQPWAELYASFEDPFGIRWMIHYEGVKKDFS